MILTESLQPSVPGLLVIIIVGVMALWVALMVREWGMVFAVGGVALVAFGVVTHFMPAYQQYALLQEEKVAPAAVVTALEEHYQVHLLKPEQVRGMGGGFVVPAVEFPGGEVVECLVLLEEEVNPGEWTTDVSCAGGTYPPLPR